MAKEVKKEEKKETKKVDTKKTTTKKKEVKEVVKKEEPKVEILESKVTKVKDEIKKVPISIIVLASLVIVLLIMNAIFGNSIGKVDLKSDITKVKKIMNEKYNDITCIDYSCDYVVATIGDELSKTSYSVFSVAGKKITEFTVDYRKLTERSTKITGITNKYMITRSTTDKGYNYAIRKLNGKSKYSTTSPIYVLNDSLAVISEGNDYRVLRYDGSTAYEKIKTYTRAANKKYVFLTTNKDTLLIDENNNVISKKYKLERDVYKDYEPRFIILRNNKNKYNYFNINSGKIVGDSFDSYAKLDDDSYKIVRKNDSYYLHDNGKQVKMSENDPNNSKAIFTKLTKKLDTKKYTAYAYGIKSTGQDLILAKKLDTNDFGIYNVKTKKYKKLFSYSQNKKSANSTISELKSNKGNIVKIVCTRSNCDTDLSIIYDLDDDKTVYSDLKNKVVISNYIEYENGYKLTRYSTLSSNNDVSGKYVLYNDKGKEVLKSDKGITVIDSEITIGESVFEDSILYSVKDNKKLNGNENLAVKLTLNENEVYKYTNSKNKYVIIDSKGNELLKVPTSETVTYSNSNIIYTNKGAIHVYNLDKSRTNSYKLKDEEGMNNENQNFVSPYRGAIFLSNPKDKTVKILNSKAKVIRSVNGAELSKVEKNRRNGIALIIVKKATKNVDKYGLYIAK